jgi:hypothetical protein
MVRYAKYARGVSPAHAVASAAVEHIVRQGLRNTVFANTKGHTKMRPLSQTMSVPRGVSRPATYKMRGGQRVRGQHRAGRRPQAKIARKKANSHNRHETLPNRLAKPVPKGKGYNNKATGVVYSHPRSQVPKWKLDRMRKYKNEVWQTVLISKSNRLAGSNNTLQLTRYPVKLPECLDSEKTMTVMFEPFCSHFSGIHSTMFRKVNSAGTDLDHDTTKRFDVIQNKAATERHDLDRLKQIDGVGASAIYYRNGYSGASASDIAATSNFTQVKAHLDQVVRQVSIDLVFSASRAFPVVCSVSVVRRIQPAIQFTLTTDDKRELCNSVSNKGIDYKMWRCEWEHTFTLPGLKVGKKIPSKSIKKILKTNFAQTNSFNENTVAGDMADASATALGSNLSGSHNEIADGAASGQFLILIKYRKKQQVQQFTYTQTIEADSDSTSSRFPSATVTLPVVTEESFDVPTHDGITGADADGTEFETGAPLTNNQGDESKASMYVHGKLKTCWGFQLQTEQIPSVTDGTNKRMQSLMIDPTYDPTDTTYGLYQASPDHVDTS